MKGIKEAFIDAGEISQMLGIGMTKAYAIIKGNRCGNKEHEKCCNSGQSSVWR